MKSLISLLRNANAHQTMGDLLLEKQYEGSMLIEKKESKIFSLFFDKKQRHLILSLFDISSKNNQKGT